MSSQNELENDDITGALCVFYSDSPFSDFSPYSFIIEGTTYASIEHYFQIQMLKSFGLFKLALKLSTISDANNFHRILRQNLRSLIQNGLFDERMFSSWRSTNATRLLKRANRAKFEQNFDLKKHLLETGDRLLVFTNKHDRLLGVGMDEWTFLDWVREQRWKIEDLLDNFIRHETLDDGTYGKNLLGLCLMDTRAEISCQPSVLSIWRQQFRTREESKNEAIVMEPENDGTIVTVDDSVSIENVDEKEINNEEEDDVQIIENSVCTEANESHETIEPQLSISTCSREMIRIPNERRILWKRRQEDGDDQSSLPSTSKSTEENEPSTLTAYDLEKRKLVLERLKALKFEKPMINPFSITINGNSITPHSDMNQFFQAVALKNSTNQIIDSDGRRKIPRLCDILRLQPPFYGQRYAIVHPQLEPGEVPEPDFGPIKVPVEYQSNYGAQQYGQTSFDHSAWTESNDLVQSQSAYLPNDQISAPSSYLDPSLSTNREEAGELWIPSSNPMKDVFESAKAGIKKLIDNAKNNQTNNNDISRLLLLRPPPIRSQPQALKRKGASNRMKSAPSYVGVIFNSKDAQMRHASNRWIKGGRLTTTGKFEECDSDEEVDESAKELGRTLRQLEATPASMDHQIEEKPSKPVQFHVVYEDTNDYSDYVKWYSDVHGCRPSDVADDEYQQYLREWYRWYKTAVKFVDIEPLSENEEDGEGGSEMSEEQKSQQLMEQWRWQQINEWELKSRNQSSVSSVAQESSTDGISISAKPLTYNGN